MVEQHTASSKDGTTIPYFVVRPDVPLEAEPCPLTDRLWRFPDTKVTQLFVSHWKIMA